eukprot:TRINITY_DN6285_c0_g1_i1.p1 TRINITY_DN6285_c0_g1~~TRINITY_DN6285_c0_g1_i1.p1  ORF type:complete len:202 (-),score=50.35 TRINITY_DN6285_c0_g1_i1:52-657(-)
MASLSLGTKKKRGRPPKSAREDDDDSQNTQNSLSQNFSVGAQGKKSGKSAFEKRDSEKGRRKGPEDEDEDEDDDEEDRRQSKQGKGDSYSNEAYGNFFPQENSDFQNQGSQQSHLNREEQNFAFPNPPLQPKGQIQATTGRVLNEEETYQILEQIQRLMAAIEKDANVEADEPQKMCRKQITHMIDDFKRRRDKEREGKLG